MSVAAAFFDGEVQGKPLEVRLQGVCRFGRSDGNDVVLESESVSRNHAMVYPSDSGVYHINDLGSSNGTFVNGYRVVSPTALKNGDRVTFGSCELRFRQEQSQATAPIRTPQIDLGATNVSFAPKFITVLVADIRGFTVLSQR